MLAIQLSEKNLHRILNESPIDRRDLEAMIEEYDDRYGPALYFIPQFEDDLGRTSWATLPEPYFMDNFEADMTKIDTQFVEIKPL